MGMVACTGRPDIKSASLEVIGHYPLGLDLSHVLGIVVPEPITFHNVAIGRRVIVSKRVSIDDCCGITDMFYTSVTLNVLGVVESDVGVSRLDAVDSPRTHLRQTFGQFRDWNEFKNVYSVVALVTHHAPTITRHHRIGRYLPFLYLTGNILACLLRRVGAIGD